MESYPTIDEQQDRQPDKKSVLWETESSTKKESPQERTCLILYYKSQCSFNIFQVNKLHHQNAAYKQNQTKEDLMLFASFIILQQNQNQK